MQYYDNMTQGEYIDAAITGNLPDEEQVRCDMMILEDDEFGEAFSERLEIHKGFREASQQWFAENGYFPVQIYKDGEFVRELFVKNEIDVTVSGEGKYEVRDDEDVIYVKFAKKAVDEDPLASLKDASADDMLLKAASSEYEYETDEVEYKGRRIKIGLLVE